MGKNEKQAKEKPLEKMTATDLRELAKEIPDITGAHGMNKAELIAEIKKARGIEETSGKKNGTKVSVRSIKEQIRTLKKQREELPEDEHKKADILRRRISRLKKKTRRLA